MKKEVYVAPWLEIIAFATEDVITVSESGSSTPEATTEPEQPILPWD